MTGDTQPPKKKFNWRLEIKADGSSVPHVELTDADKEILRVLFNSQQWQLYRAILVASKDAYTTAMLPMEDPNKLLKHTGIIVGLNFAINQLGVLVATFNNKAERVAEESKNQPKPSR